MSDNPRGRGRGGRGDRGGRGRGDGDRGRGGDGRGRGRGDFGGGGNFRGGNQGGGGGSRGGPHQMAIRGGPQDGHRGRGRGGRGGGGGPPRGRAGIYLAGERVPQPDVGITATEDELVKQTCNKMFEGFPGRRGYGTKGTKIILRTNYLTMTTAFEEGREETPLYRYELTVNGEISKPKRRRLIEQLMASDSFQNMHAATDFATILVTTKKLDVAKLTTAWKKLTLAPEATAQPAQQGPVPGFVNEARARNTFDVVPRYIGAFNLSEMIRYLRSTATGGMYRGREEVIQILNVVLTKPPHEHQLVKNVGQNKFYPYGDHPGKESFNLTGGLDALRGYFSSVRPAVGRLLLNVNVTAGAFYQAVPLLDLIKVFGGGANTQTEAFIRMLKVEAFYIKDGQKQPFMRKVKSIVGFAKPVKATKDHEGVQAARFGNAHEVKFTYTDGSNSKQRVTVADYFKTRHGISLSRAKEPVLNVGTLKDPQYLPMELCKVLPGQPYRRLLNGDQTTAMLAFAARAPNLNAMSIAGDSHAPGAGLRILRLAGDPGAPDPQIQSVLPFGVRTGTEMLTVPARILSAPQIKYGKKSVTPRGGSWNSMDQTFITPGRFSQWKIVVINRRGQNGDALVQRESEGPSSSSKLFANFEQFLKNYGIQMGRKAQTQTLLLNKLDVQNRDANDKLLDDCFADAKRSGIDIMLVILPGQDKWLYARIKFHGDVTYGVGSICAVGSKIQKSDGQGMYFGNLALKFNLKGGGISHSVANTVVPPIDNTTMVVGIDVTHPSPGSAAGAPSIASIVASVDPHMFQWPGSIRTQPGRQEMVGVRREKSKDGSQPATDGLTEMIIERLELWQRKNQNRLPTKIVVYRDGVSEGQYKLVLEHEVPSFNTAFAKKYGAEAKWPKMAIIVVGKRHHTRFYPTRPEDADCDPRSGKGSHNPQPGTVVDRGITGKFLREFYLQAHKGLQGTARPAHYVVIKDDISFSADQMEQFTHHLCYLFNRATKAVSICPPAYYADLLCERGRSYLFTSLAEDTHSDSGGGGGGGGHAVGGWTKDVHPRLCETTWYV